MGLFFWASMLIDKFLIVPHYISDVNVDNFNFDVFDVLQILLYSNIVKIALISSSLNLDNLFQ
jgi:hypothetical protein